MSRLEELIQELCPDGVEYFKLGDICSVKARIGWQRLNKSEYLTEGEYYLVTGVDICANNRVDFNSCYYVSKKRYEMDENIQLKNGDIILTKDGTIGKVAIIEEMDKPAVLNSHLFVIRDKSEKLNNKFLMYTLLSKDFRQFIKKNQTQGTIPGLTQSTIVKFDVPVPPEEVQNEIVRILDSFTELTAELTTELTAELTARRQQYGYYLNLILNYNQKKWKKSFLNEIADVRDGTHASPKPSASGFRLATSKNITSGTIDLNSCYLIDEKDYKEINLRSKVDQYDVLFSMIGTVGEVAIVNEEPDFAIKNMGLIKTSGNLLLAKFIAYWIQSNYARAYIYKNLKGTAPRYLSLERLRNFPIYLPEKAELDSVVKKLDVFHNICTDLSDGLPIEIKARQKQYEYYRDKLLTFKEQTA